MAVKVMSYELACEALTVQLRSLSIIDDDNYVENFKRVPEGIEVRIVKEKK